MMDGKQRKIVVLDYFKEIFKCKYRTIMVELPKEHEKHIQQCCIPDTVRV
jgi:hypothetical protein